MSLSVWNRRRMNSAESVEEKRPHMKPKVGVFLLDGSGDHTASGPSRNRSFVLCSR